MPKKAPDTKKMPVRIDWWLVAVILLPVFYFLPELLGQNVFAGIDTSRLNMPLRHFDREMFAQGAIPLWNPYMFAGFPHLAESESGVFYPGNIFIHMPGDFFHWYSVEVIAHFMIAGAGFYTWMRMRGHGKPSSAFLAMTYTVTPFLIFHITAFGLFTSIVWLPWYFVIFDKGLKSDHPVITGLWFALFLGVMLVSGSVQSAFLGISGVLLYGLGKIIAAKDFKERLKLFLKILAVLIPCILAPLIAAIQLLPTYELSQYSERAATTGLEFYDLGTWLTFPRLMSIFLFPALDNPADIQDYGSSLCYMGIVPFLLAIMSMYNFPDKRRIFAPLLIAGIIALLLGFGRNLPGYDYLVSFPPFSLFRYPGRFAHVALTLFLPLAAPSIDWLIKNASEFKKWVLPVIGIVLVGSLAIQILLTYPFSRMLVQERSQFDQSLAFFDEIKNEFPTDWEYPRVLMAGSHELMDPDALNKLGFKAQTDIWDNMSGNASGLRGVTAVRGLTPLNQNDWKLILRDTIQTRMDTVMQRNAADGEPKIVDDICLNIFRMLGIDILLLEGDDWSVDGYELWKSDLVLPYHDGLCAYRAGDGYMPDAWFAESVTVGEYSDYPGFLRYLGEVDVIKNPGFGDAIGPADYSFTSDTGNLEGTRINSIVRGPNEIRFDVSVGPDAGMLVTGENDVESAWDCYVDGEKTPVFKTNFLLNGIILETGDHEVVMKYHPASFVKGTNATVLGLVGFCLFLAAFTLLYKRKTKTVHDKSDE